MSRPLSLPRDRISVLLLEGISQSAVDYFSSSGYVNLTHLPKALDDKDLKSHIAEAHCGNSLTHTSDRGSFQIG